MRNLLLTVFLAFLLTGQALAEDSDIFGISNQQEQEKAKKAPRETNPVCMNPTCTGPVKAMGTGVALGLLGPVGLVVAPFAGMKFANNHAVELNQFYSGTVVRGKIKEVVYLSGYGKEIAKSLHKAYGLDMSTMPALVTIENQLVRLILDVDGPANSERYVYARKDSGYEIGDIVDAKTLDGIYPLVFTVNTKLVTDLNRHIPRTIAIYCKHDNSGCQNDYESSLGVLYRHTDTEFPPPQYLIDPAIIAADQARIRREEEEKKANTDSGSFSLM